MKNTKLWVPVVCVLCIAALIFAGVTAPEEPVSADSQSVTVVESSVPRYAKGKYVIVQDYADNETSKSVLDSFAKAWNEKPDYYHAADDPGVFILNAAVPFEEGVLICGYELHDGEVYSNLYYFENGKITYRTMGSYCWSLNYTVFRDHTIAYGTALGRYDQNGKLIFDDKVVAEFANGETASQRFKNIPFKSETKWRDGATDGYILIADGQTWVKNIEFYGKDGSVAYDWHLSIFNSDIDVWKGGPNGIWDTYMYTEMCDEDYRTTVHAIDPVHILINGVELYESEIGRFLMDDSIAMEYIWRNNNYFFYKKIEVEDASEIEIKGLDDGDEVMWVALDKDDGSPITDYSTLISNKAPTQKGNYCLIVRHNGGKTRDYENMYYSAFVSIVSGSTVTIPKPVPLDVTLVSVGELLPEVDYGIPNGPSASSGIATDGERFYFFGSVGGNEGIVSTNIKGKDRKLVLENVIAPIYSDGWLYYFAADDGIYRVRSDGQGKSRILDLSEKTEDDGPFLFSIVMAEDGWVYCDYANTFGSTNLYRMKENTKEPLADDFMDGLTIYQGNLYYRNEDSRIIKYDIVQKKREAVTDFEVSGIPTVVNGAVYYSDEDGSLCIYDLKTKKMEIYRIDPFSEAVQFHNYLVCVTDAADSGNAGAGFNIVLFDTKTKKAFTVKGLRYIDAVGIAADEQSITCFQPNSGQLDRLYFDNNKLMAEKINLG